MNKLYGYARVSSKSQNELRQIVALHEMGVTKKNIFVDKQSGKDFERPMYKRLVRKLKPNDLMYVKSIDRLGRNYEDIIEQWKLITKEKQADIVLALLSYIAQNERENIRQRQAEGIAAAKAKGVKFGAKRKELPDNFEEIGRLWADRKLTLDIAAKKCGMARSTFYKKARSFREE